MGFRFHGVPTYGNSNLIRMVGKPCMRKEESWGKLKTFGGIMKKLMLFLVLFVVSEARAEPRVAIEGVPVLGQGPRRLWTAPPNIGNAHEGFSVPYHQTQYAWNHPNHLTLGGTYNGKAWYFNSRGYVSPHYGEHYMPTGGLMPGYIGEPVGAWTDAGPHITATGGTVYEAWVPIGTPAVPTMPVVTNPYPRYSSWYLNTPEFAGWVGDYATFWKYLSRHPTWRYYQGRLYDSRLYSEPPGGWEHPEEDTRVARLPTEGIPVPSLAREPKPPHAEVKEYTVEWHADGTQFRGETGSVWKLATTLTDGPVDKKPEVRGYIVSATDKGRTKTLFHQVVWDGWDWNPIRIFEKQ